VALAASEAINLAGLPLVHAEHIQAGLPPHFVPEKFFFGNDPQLWDFFVDIDDTFALKMRALKAHDSQMEFLAEEFSRQAGAAGLDLGSILGEDSHEAMALISWAMESRAEAIGPSAGSRLGEAFRYQRFHPLIEDILELQTS
jgi:LmbE family N-acetylglucosaminyl deacetylase